MRYIDPDFAARRQAFFICFTATIIVEAVAHPDLPLNTAMGEGLVLGVGGALVLGCYHSLLDWLLETLERRSERKAALAKEGGDA